MEHGTPRRGLAIPSRIHQSAPREHEQASALFHYNRYYVRLATGGWIFRAGLCEKTTNRNIIAPSSTADAE